MNHEEAEKCEAGRTTRRSKKRRPAMRMSGKGMKRFATRESRKGRSA